MLAKTRVIYREHLAETRIGDLIQFCLNLCKTIPSQIPIERLKECKELLFGMRTSLGEVLMLAARKSQIWHWFISREGNEGNVHDRVITQWLRSNMKTALWTKRNTRALPIPSPVCTDDDAWVRKPISLHALNMCNAVEQQQTRGRGWSVPRYQMSTEPIDRQRSLEWVAGVYPLE